MSVYNFHVHSILNNLFLGLSIILNILLHDYKESEKIPDLFTELELKCFNG